MQQAALRALEFDRIKDVLAEGALTPLGRARVEALVPSGDLATVEDLLQLTVEGVRFATAGGSLAVDAPETLVEVLGGLDVQDQPLDPPALLGLARFVQSVSAIGRALAHAGGRLAAIGQRAASFDDEIAAVRRAIDASGDVRDDASSALREIRDQLRRARLKLRTTLDGLVRGRETSKYLQDQIVTDRNGRYVLVVRAEHRDAIAGIVHGSSSSGASLYLEPLSVVQANNDIVALGSREAEEVRRILLALTNAFRLRGDELEALIDVAAEVDELHAKVELARRLDARAPDLVGDGRLEFLDARHPLLIVRGEAASTAVVIGSDLRIVPPVRALVISGPNTGGKTVALKAVGLLALMAQAGLLIPVAAGSRFTPFHGVFADIGDDQSIAASLSTFSGHIANLVEMNRALKLPALVLLDEVGGGTDPVEGGALGIAVIDHFRRRGAVVVATTHDDALKSYAATTEGVTTAAFGFNPETYAPTYRLIYGAPGRSLAFEIAERLGMPASLIADARTRRSGRESLLAEHLARVDRELAALDAARASLGGEQAKLEAARADVLARESRLAEREAVLKRRMDDRLNEKLRDARAEVDKIVGRLRERAETLAERRGPALSTGDVGGLRAEGRAALEGIGAGFGPSGGEPAPDDRLTSPPANGQAVYVSTFGAEGIVRGGSGKDVDVEIRGKRMRVPLSALRKTGGTSRPSEGSKFKGGMTAVTNPAGAQASRELMVIGSTVEEAVTRAEKFLDDALLADERRLRVVHGHGTGRLREALRTFFRQHPLVASVAPAPDNEGGAGATIVELKD